jgi:lysophospholipase L1-like esterase
MEYTASVLTKWGIATAYSPMMTVAPRGSDDWRPTHITADPYREPDPELLWRSVDRRPYTSQRFKGPVAEIPKPEGVVRIICYGDSNTDGPRDGGWPAELQRLLEETRARSTARFEVLNAGVVGYTSHQGLLRFRREVAVYRPDVALVSFGWNDVTETSRGTDRSYRIPPLPLLSLQRLLLKYRFYRVALGAMPTAESPTGGVLVPRVPIDDYEDNLRGFLREARNHDCIPVFLTRPYKEDAVQTGWRAKVPGYNRRLISFGETEGAVVVDIQGRFADRSSQLLADDCHLNVAGRSRMAHLLRDELVAAGVVSDFR